MRLYIYSDAGGVPHTRRWARWFAQRGHEVHVVSFNPKVLPDYSPATVHVVWAPKMGNNILERLVKVPVIFFRIRSLLEKYPPDIVHAHSAGGYSWMAMLCGFRPYVITPWGTDLLIDIKNSIFNRFLTQQALLNAALVTTDGVHFVDILKQLGVPESKILVHSFGTDINLFSPGVDDGERKLLDLGAGPVVISTRTLNPVHNVETFIRAIPIISEKFKEVRFIVVGDGVESDKLFGIAKSLGILNVVRFVGRVEEARLRSLLRASDVYVSTSLMDAGLAGSTAEAMSTGLPVVQADNSDNSVWTPNGVGGYLFGNRDIYALAESVCKLLSDKFARMEMGQRNRTMIIERSNRDLELLKVEKAYSQLVANK